MSDSAAGISAEGPDRPPAAPAGIFGALLAFQQRAPKIQKDGINPHFGSRYPTYETVLAAILPELNDCGLVLVQAPEISSNKVTGEVIPVLTTRIIHVASEEELSTTMALLASKADPQGQGSAITYARRYSLMAMLALSADPDDDGNRAVQSAPAGKPEAKGHSTTQPEQSVPREQKPATGPQRDRLLELTDKLAGAGHIATEAAEKLRAAAAKPDLLRGKAAELIERLEAVEKKAGAS